MLEFFICDCRILGAPLRAIGLTIVKQEHTVCYLLLQNKNVLLAKGFYGLYQADLYETVQLC